MEKDLVGFVLYAQPRWRPASALPMHHFDHIKQQQQQHRQRRDLIQKMDEDEQKARSI